MSGPAVDFDQLEQALYGWTGTITQGRDKSQRRWRLDARWRLSFAELVALLDPRRVPEGSRADQLKNGTCLIPGGFAPDPEGSGEVSKRHAAWVAFLWLAVYDFDSGTSYVSIVERLRQHRVPAIIVPTYSHRQEDGVLSIDARHWPHYLATFGTAEEMVRNWLKNRYITPVELAGPVTVQEQPARTIVAPDGTSREVRPRVELHYRLVAGVPRWRVYIPLREPWYPEEGPSLGAAKAWSEAYLAVRRALGFDDADPSCADAPRLHFDARWPRGWPVLGPWDVPPDGEPGPLDGLGVVVGALQTMEELAALSPSEPSPEAAAEMARWAAGRAAWKAFLETLPGQPRGKARPGQAASWVVSRPDGRMVDLQGVYRLIGRHLPLKTWIMERRPEWVSQKRPDETGEGHQHIVCPLLHLHSDQTDQGGTFCVDADEAGRGRIVCDHTHGQGMLQGQWLEVLLNEEVISWEELDQIIAEHGPDESSELWNELEVEEESKKTQNLTPEEDADLPPGWRDLDPREHIARWIARLNQKYFICGGGRTRVVQERFTPELNSWDYNAWYGSARGFEEFNALFLHEQIEVGRKPNGVAIFSTPAALWVKHPNARRYIDGMVFKPPGVPVPATKDQFNLWRGFGVEPRQGSWSLLKEHLRHIWCRDDPATFAYLMGWLAHMVQHPEEKPGVMVVVQSEEEGVGKSLVGHALLRLVGTHGLYLQSAGQVLHKFNIFLADKILLFADETTFPGDKRNGGWLKAMITEGRLHLEGKNLPLEQVASYLRLLVFSNDIWVVQASLTSRRYLVLKPSAEHMQDHAYFAAIQAELEAGGYEAMLYDLLHCDLSGFNPREAPVTQALLEQRTRSLDHESAWWLAILERGYVLEAEQDWFQEWHDEVSTQVLEASYQQFMRKRRFGGEALSRGELCKQVVAKFAMRDKYLTKAVVKERPRTGGGYRPTQPVVAKRAPGYVLGSLKDARTKFNEITKLNIEFPPAIDELLPRLVVDNTESGVEPPPDSDFDEV